MKLYRLTESELTSVVSNATRIVLNEFWYSREDLINKISDGRVEQIVQNWCILRYCHYYGQNQTYNHWKTELRAIMEPIAKMFVDIRNKRKAVYQVLVENCKLNDAKVVLGLAHKKFITEQMYDEYTMGLCCNDFVNELTREGGLIDALSIRTQNESLAEKVVYDYVDSVFPNID